MMAASVLALPSGQWQPACWLTHFNYDGSQRAGLPTSTMMVANVLAFHLHNGSQQAGFHCLLSAKVFAWLSTRTISAEGCAHSQQIALSPAFRALDTHDLRRGLRAQPANRTLACISRTRHARSPQRVARAAGKSHSRLHFAHSTRTISAEGCARSRQIALSPAFRALDTHDLRRGLRAQPANRTLACISRTRHARSPQRIARAAGKSHSRLHFAHSTRAISAEGCAHSRQIALSPTFRALETHDLRRGLRAQPANRTLACISRTRHARSPQRVARAAGKSHSHLHFAHSTRTISAEGCAHSRQIALSPAFRALDTHDLRRGLRAQPANRTLACISRTRHARSPQRVARAPGKSHSRLHFAHSTRTISAEGCARSRQIALSPAFRALDTHDLRRGLRAHPANRTLACISRTRHARSPQRVALSVDAVRLALRLEKRIYKVGKCFCFFIRTSPALVFHTHTCLLIAGHLPC